MTTFKFKGTVKTPASFMIAVEKVATQLSSDTVEIDGTYNLEDYPYDDWFMLNFGNGYSVWITGVHGENGRRYFDFGCDYGQFNFVLHDDSDREHVAEVLLAVVKHCKETKNADYDYRAGLKHRFI